MANVVAVRTPYVYMRDYERAPCVQYVRAIFVNAEESGEHIERVLQTRWPMHQKSRWRNGASAFVKLL